MYRKKLAIILTAILLATLPAQSPAQDSATSTSDKQLTEMILITGGEFTTDDLDEHRNKKALPSPQLSRIFGRSAMGNS